MPSGEGAVRELGGAVVVMGLLVEALRVAGLKTVVAGVVVVP
ncbi:MAG: hypothetical protein P4N59_26170 [Negativicutes bacterium]|nr:hypothetical protein [Negativicutes bacterium]